MLVDLPPNTSPARWRNWPSAACISAATRTALRSIRKSRPHVGHPARRPGVHVRVATQASGRTDRGRARRPFAKRRRGRHPDRSRRARQVKTLTPHFSTYLGWARELEIRRLSQPAHPIGLAWDGHSNHSNRSVYARGVVPLCDTRVGCDVGKPRRHSA